MKHNPISSSRKEIIRKMLIKGLVRQSLVIPGSSEPVMQIAKFNDVIEKKKVGPFKLVLTKSPRGAHSRIDGEYIMYGGPDGIWETDEPFVKPVREKCEFRHCQHSPILIFDVSGKLN